MISSQEINFVAFHIDIDDKVLKKAQSVAKAVNNEETENQLELMFSSVKKYYPKASLFILTDKTSKVNEYEKSKDNGWLASQCIVCWKPEDKFSPRRHLHSRRSGNKFNTGSKSIKSGEYIS